MSFDTKLNRILFKEQPLLEGPFNFFECKTGPYPSFGIFRVDDATLAEITKNWDAGTLTFSDGERTVDIQNIYFVEAREVQESRKLFDIVLADERILWQAQCGDCDYNTYKRSRAWNSDAGEFELENLNGETEWTWEELINDLTGLLGVTIDDTYVTYPSRKPRNIIADGQPIAKVLEHILAELYWDIAVDFTSQSTPYYWFYEIGGDEPPVLEETLAWPDREYLVSGYQVVLRNPKLKPSSVRVAAACDPDADNGNRIRFHGNISPGGDAGNLILPSTYAEHIVDGSSYNDATLDAIAAEILSAYDRSLTPVLPDDAEHLLYAGIHEVRQGPRTQSITWQSNTRGAYTLIKRYRPAYKRYRPWDTLFSYGLYALPTGAEGTWVGYVDEHDLNSKTLKVRPCEGSLPDPTPIGTAGEDYIEVWSPLSWSLVGRYVLVHATGLSETPWVADWFVLTDICQYDNTTPACKDI